jgi:hypothetical protein
MKMKAYMISLCPENTSGFVSDIKLFESMDEAFIASKLIDKECRILIHTGDIWSDIATLYNIMHKFPHRLLVAGEHNFVNAVDVITYNDKDFNRPIKVYAIENHDLEVSNLNKVGSDGEKRVLQAYEDDDSEWYSSKFSEGITSNPDDLSQLLEVAPEWLLILNVDHLTLLSARLINTFADKEIKTVSDITQFNTETMLKWSGVGKKSLLDLCASLKATYQSYVRTYAKEANLANVLEADTSSLKSIEHRVFQRRFGDECQSETLESLGNSMGMTRERVRQIERKALDKLRVFPLWRKRLVSNKLDALLQEAVDLRQPLLLKDIVKEVSWFSEFEDNIDYLGRIIELYTDSSFFVFKINSNMVVSRVSADQWKTLVSDVLTYLREHEGKGWVKKDVELFIQSKLEEHRAIELAEELYTSISSHLRYFTLKADTEKPTLNAVGSGYLPVLLAVLRGLEEPKHYRKIALLCQKIEPSIDERRVQASLAENADLFDLGVYGLKGKHLMLADDEINSIMDMLNQIIRTDMKRQWNCEELLKLLHARLDVPESLNKYIVSILLEDIPYMKYLGRLVWVLDEKGTSATQRIDLQEAATEILRKAKKPMDIEEIKNIIAKTRGVGKHFALQKTANIKRVKDRKWVYEEK